MSEVGSKKPAEIGKLAGERWNALDTEKRKEFQVQKFSFQKVTNIWKHTVSLGRIRTTKEHIRQRNRSL